MVKENKLRKAKTTEIQKAPVQKKYNISPDQIKSIKKIIYKP